MAENATGVSGYQAGLKVPECGSHPGYAVRALHHANSFEKHLNGSNQDYR
jgi:hypothetical protein